MKDALSSIDWNSELNNLSVQDAWNNFSGVLEKAMEYQIPTHTIGSRPNKKRQAYMDRQGMKLMKAKQRAWKAYTDSSDSYDYQRYCKARNKLRTHTRKIRQDFEEALAGETKANPKAFWKYTKSKLTVKSGVSDLKDSEGVVHSAEDAKAGPLNDFFSSVFIRGY